MKPQQQQEHQLFNDPEGQFNAAFSFTEWGASFIRPIFYHGQGKRAYGKWTFIAFCSFPFIAEYTRSPEVVLAWKVWTLMFIIRWLLPDRRQLYSSRVELEVRSLFLRRESSRSACPGTAGWHRDEYNRLLGRHPPG